MSLRPLKPLTDGGGWRTCIPAFLSCRLRRMRVLIPSSLVCRSIGWLPQNSIISRAQMRDCNPTCTLERASGGRKRDPSASCYFRHTTSRQQLLLSTSLEIAADLRLTTSSFSEVLFPKWLQLACHFSNGRSLLPTSCHFTLFLHKTCTDRIA